MSPNIDQEINRCEEIVNGTGKLNQLLHNPEFVKKKMSQIKKVFTESSTESSLALVLTQLSSFLGGDETVKRIVRQECGNLSMDPLYPCFLLYCSIIVYVEYVRMHTESKSGGRQ